MLAVAAGFLVHCGSDNETGPETDASIVTDAAPDSGHRDSWDLGNTGAFEGESVYLSDGCTRCQCFAGGLVECDNDECQNKQSCTVGETVSHPSGVTVDCVCADAAGRRTCDNKQSDLSARQCSCAVDGGVYEPGDIIPQPDSCKVCKCFAALGPLCVVEANCP